MNARLMLFLAAAAIAAPAAAQETYVFDPAHSQPGFEADHLGFSTQHGGFSKMTGKVAIDRAAKKGLVEVSIDAASVRTFDPRLDAAVKGEKFFNVENFPTIVFRGDDLQFEGDRLVAVKGHLTLLGVTKPVTLQLTRFTCGPHPFNKKPMCGGVATGTFKRSEFGMTTGVQTLTPGDEVRLVLPFEAYRSDV